MPRLQERLHAEAWDIHIVFITAHRDDSVRGSGAAGQRGCFCSGAHSRSSAFCRRWSVH